MVGGNGNKSDEVPSCDHLPDVAGRKFEFGRQDALIWALILREAAMLCPQDPANILVPDMQTLESLPILH